MMIEGAKSSDEGKGRAAGEGGSRAAGGISFQAKATAYFIAHLLTGRSLGGVSSLIDSAPIEIAAETAGAGDDIQIKLADI